MHTQPNSIIIFILLIQNIFTDVLCAAFHKIKYFDIVNISKFLTTLIRSREKQVLMLAFGRGRWAVFQKRIMIRSFYRM